MARPRAERVEEITDERWSAVTEFNRRLVDEFLMESVQLAPSTLVQYKSSLRIFYVWVDEVLQGKKAYEIKRRDFLRYQNSLIRRGLSSNGVKLKRAAVSSMNGYLINFYESEEEFATFRNFVEGVAQPSPNIVYEKIALTVEEVQMIKDTLLEDEEYQILAAFSVMYDSASRRSEFIQLKKDIVELEELKTKEGELSGIYRTPLIRAKGRGEQGNPVPLFLSKEAMEHVKLWLEHRGEDDCDHIFVSRQGGEYQQIHATTVNYWFTEIISDIVGRRVNPHIVRASRSSHLIKQNEGKLNQAQRLLNHSSSEITDAHYNLNEDEDEIFDMF